MANRAQDWLRQGERDLQHATISRTNEQHEWACFASHQAAEKALKALHLSLGQEAWGHVLTQLIDELPQASRPADELIEKARVLDSFYIPTRYPNGHPSGAPFEHYGTLQSEQAVDYARQIIEFARDAMARSSDSTPGG